MLVAATLAVTLIVAMVAGPIAIMPVSAQSASVGDKMAVVGLDGATLQETPGGRTLAQLTAGDVVTAIGRTQDGVYLRVKTERGVEGWVDAKSVVIFGVTALPVIAEPTPTPTSSPTPTPSPTPLQPTATATQPPAPTARAASTAATTAAATPAQAMSAAQSATPVASVTTSVASTPLMADANAGVIGVVTGAGATLRDAPDGERIAELPGAETVTVIGRDADATWLMALTLDGKEGWLNAADLVVFGVDALPVVAGLQEDAATVAAVDATATLTAAEEITASVDAITTTVAAAPTTIPEEPSTNEGVAPQAVMNGVANVSGARLNIRSGPDSSYRIIGKAAGGEELAIAARSEDGAWLVIVRDDLPLGAGWVSASLVRLDGDADALPTSDSIFGAAPASAPATPTPAAESGASAAAPSASPTTTPVAAATQAAAQPAPRSTGPTGLTGNIVFQDGRGSIYVYELASGNVRFLTNGLDPAISRDGRKVAFLRNGLHVINLDGTGERQISGSKDLMSSPKWSPEGDRIVFSSLIGEYKCFDTEFFG